MYTVCLYTSCFLKTGLWFSNHKNHLKSFLKHGTWFSESHAQKFRDSRWDSKMCVSNKFTDDTGDPDPRYRTLRPLNHPTQTLVGG